MKKLLFTLLFLTLGSAWGGAWEDSLTAVGRNDYVTAIKLWRPLADAGNADAQSTLGYMYDKGQGVTQDYKEAARLWRLVAEQGLADAQVNLGFMYTKGQGVLQDYVRAHMWFNLASSAGETVNAAKNRDIIAKLMTPQQIQKAQEMAKACQARNFKGCW
jgi:uncharacterized protein